MKHRALLFFLVFTGFLGFAQQNYQDKLALLKEIETEIARKAITWETTKEIVLNDSVSYTIQDIVQAKEIDSLWLTFLFDSDRYPEMYKTVTEETFEEVTYEELSTELLKERLEELNARTPFHIE